MTIREFIKYSLTSFIAVAGLLSIVAVFNAMVDPYNIYHLITIPGLNANKPSIYHRVRLLKAYEVRRIKPQSIILGTSRCHMT